MRRQLTAVLRGSALLCTTVLLAGAVGCASPMPIDPEGPDPATEWPEGREFWSTTITDDGAAKTLVEGTKLIVRFGKPGQLELSAGCNHLSLQAKLEGDRIVPYDYAATMMGCLGSRAAQDVWMQDFFFAGPSWSIGGNELRLMTEHTVVWLTDKEVLDPDRTLTGQRWVVTTIISTETASSALVDNAFLEFAAGGTFTGKTGCATLTGTSTVEGNTITVGAVQRGERPCEGLYLDLAAKLDQAVMATLTGTVTFKIDARTLTLQGPNGNGLVLSAG
jgi:heat shock protein HslJ